MNNIGEKAGLTFWLVFQKAAVKQKWAANQLPISKNSKWYLATKRQTAPVTEVSLMCSFMKIAVYGRCGETKSHRLGLVNTLNNGVRTI
ncbi:hypothetical protein [Rufibacter roseus]|uniref:Uncharacterized protein n=1 Tax=Rufibacter roseus TaxID=1567108 RepID=A0ABW2DJQ4_9BACT|nr:hypothetical protein [Rufibacter roseus]